MEAAEWAWLLPDAPAWAAPILLAAGLLGALITTTLGAGGGLLLLAVMTVFLPVTATIPLHGVIQAGAGASRALLLWRHLSLPLLLAFAVGAVAGAAAGSVVLVRLPEPAMQLILGGFILLLAWVPVPRLHRVSRSGLGVVAAITSALTLFVGATGPLVAAFLRALRLDRLQYVATFSTCMLLQHGLKVGVFALAGFAFAPWVPFLAAMLIAVFAGSWLGRHVLVRMDNVLFHRALAVVLTVLALRLLYTGMLGVL